WEKKSRTFCRPAHSESTAPLPSPGRNPGKGIGAAAAGSSRNPAAEERVSRSRGEGSVEMWWEWDGGEEETAREETPVDFDFISLLAKPKDYYKILEVDYDASEETIRSSYIRLALKWHPDKKQDEENATSRFQDINEAYQVLGALKGGIPPQFYKIGVSIPLRLSKAIMFVK
ncbi:unnamed protein product, partial [Urochloa humidicola]